MFMQQFALVLVLGILNVLVQGQCPCEDVLPDGQFTCEQQRKFGKCSDKYMIEKGFCQATCNRCPKECPYEPPSIDLSCGCTDVPPNKDFTCDQQRQFGSCLKSWMQDGSFCEASCRRCVCVNGVKCSDISPPGKILCPKQFEFGKCSASWMQANNYCSVTCGSCPTQAQLDQIEQITTLPQIKETFDDDLVSIKEPLPFQEPLILVALPVVDVDVQLEEPNPELGFPLFPFSLINESQAEPDVEFDNVNNLFIEVEDDDVESDVFQLNMMIASEPEEEEFDDENVVAPTFIPTLFIPVPEPEFESNNSSDCDSSILETLESNPDLNLLTSMVKAAGMEAVLSSSNAHFTIFAPNNQAIDRFVESEDLDLRGLLRDPLQTGSLQAILGYHILNVSLTSQDLIELAFVETLLGSDVPLFVEVQRQQVSLEAVGSAADIITPDIQVCKSTVHIISNVLISSSTSEQPIIQTTASPAVPVDNTCVQASVMETLMQIPEAETLLLALEAAQFNDSLFIEPLTIFVPTLRAFQQLLSQLAFDSLDEAIETDSDKELISSILLNHVVLEYYPSQALGDDGPLTTLNGSFLIADSVDRIIEIEAVGSLAEVVEADVSETCNVAVHIVDSVLLPIAVNPPNVAPSPSSVEPQLPGPSIILPQSPTLEQAPSQECETLSSVLNSRPELELFVATAETAGLQAVLNDPTQEITFFVPVNNAFQELTSSLGEGSRQIMTNLDYLNVVLAYHAVDGVYSSQELAAGQTLSTHVQTRQGSAPITLTTIEQNDGVTIIGQGSSGRILEANLSACGSIIHIIDTVLLPVAQS